MHCIFHVLYSAISVTFVLILADSIASYRSVPIVTKTRLQVIEDQKHRRTIALVAGFAFSSTLLVFIVMLIGTPLLSACVTGKSCTSLNKIAEFAFMENTITMPTMSDL